MKWRLPRRRVRTVGAFTALTVSLATLAVLHDGTEVADVDLNDGGVWVTNRNLNGLQVAAHLNYPSKQLDANTKTVAGDGFDLTQEANHVVAHTNGTDLSAVDTSTWALDNQPGQTPAGATASQGTRTVAIADPGAGKVWVLSSDEVSTFDPKAKPLVAGSTGVRAVVGKDDLVHTLTPGGTLSTHRHEDGTWVSEKVGRVPATEDEEMSQVVLTAVGDTPVAFNPAAGWLAWPDHRHDLEDARTLRLQPAGTPSAHVALAGPSGLVLVPLAGTAPRTVAALPGGVPVPPVTVGSCTYAAWSGTDAYLRECVDAGQDVPAQAYPQLAGSNELVFRTNRDVVVLNNPSNGDVFLVNENMEKVADWATVLSNLDQDKKDEDDPTIATVERSEQNTPPKPADDQFGVRPGASVTLPVLANDADADGDVLLAQLKTEKVPGIGTVELVREGRAVRVTVASDAQPGASGTFTYAASDGRKNGTVEAQTTVTVHGPGENGAVTELDARRDLSLTIRARSGGTKHLLADYVDADGDPFWVSGATFGEGLVGSVRPDGKLVVTDTGQPDLPRKRVVKVTMTDGRDGGQRTVEVPVTVLGVDTNAEPVAQADFVTALVSTQEVSNPAVVDPLANDTDPNNDELHFSLGQVPADSGVRAEVGKDNSLTVTSTKPGTAYLPYTLSDGQTQVTSVIRVETLTPSQARPVPDNDLAVLAPHGDMLVPVLANDTDPMGGVLVVQSVNVGQSHEITAEVVDHETIRVRDVNLRPGVPVTVNYDVGNGVASGTGQVTVVLDSDRRSAPPVALDDEAVVRVGDVVTVPVLANDSSPGDLPLEVTPLAEDAVSLGAELGTAWVSENKVRFKAAPGTPGGPVRISYTTMDSEKRAQSATVDLTVVPASGANSAPTPRGVEGRLIQGASTRIVVPLEGVDPDGDSVSIVGLAPDRVPTKGSLSIDGDTLTYTAAGGELNRGTDTFGLVLEDEFGAQATGEVRVGIAAPPSSNLPPSAQSDRREVRPGRLLAVDVAANDIDPEGGELRLSSEFEQVSGPEASARIVAGRIQLRTPEESGTVVYRYTIKDDLGAESSADLTVQVSPEAPVLPPVVRDDRVPAADVIGKTEITVDVLRNDEDPDGAVSELTPQVDEPGVRVVEQGRLVVPVKARRQVVLYTLTDPDGGIGRGVVVVPGSESDAARRPAVRPDAELPIKVRAGTSRTIELADYVVVRPDRTPSLPFAENVTAGPGHDGSPLKTGDAQITFGAKETFHGATSVVATVSDARGDGDASALTSTLTLPVHVNANGSAQPELRVPEVSVATGEPWSGALADLASDPDPGDAEKLQFSPSEVPSALGVQVDEEAGKLKVAAADGARPGQYQFTLSVTDQSTAPVSKKVDVTVVNSTRPLLQVSDATLEADAGQAVRLDLADQVTYNPFEGEEPPRLVGTPSLQPEGAGTVRATGLTLTVTPRADFNGTMRLTYVLADATGLPARQVQGQATVSVRGLPSAPTGVTAEAGNAQVKVNWTSAEPNGAPITGYRLEWQGGSTGSTEVAGPGTSATATGLRNGKAYRFRVTAVNEVGSSARASEWSRPVTPDDVPSAPGGLKVQFGDGQLQVSWTKPVYDGSPVTDYVVSVNGAETRVGTQTRTTLTGLTNGTVYDVKVRAFNNAEADPFGAIGAGPWTAVVSEHPNAEPQVTSRAITADGPDADPSAVLSWTADDGGHSVSQVQVRRTTGELVTCTGDKSQRSCRVSLLGKGRDQQFQVRLFNRANQALGIDGWGEWSAPTDKVTGATRPDAVDQLKVENTGESGTAVLSWQYPRERMRDADRVEFFTNRTGSRAVQSGVTVTGLTNGTDTRLEVWAVTYANESNGGGGSEPSPRAGVVANAFAPCQPTVASGVPGYQSSRFAWQVTSRGRDCAWSGDQGFASGQGGGGSSTHVASGAKATTITLQVQATTRTRAGDRAVPVQRASNTGRTFAPKTSGSGHHPVSGPQGACQVNCSRFGVVLDEFKPNTVAYCPITTDGTGGPDDGRTFWYAVGPTNSAGHFNGLFAPNSGYNMTNYPAYPAGYPPCLQREELPPGASIR